MPRAARAATVVSFLREVYDEWRRDQALSHGAALAYYALFSLAPLLVLVITVAGLVLGRAAAQGEIVAQIKGLVGADAAATVEGMVLRMTSPRAGVIASVASLVTMVVGASGVLGQLQTALNQIWGVRADAAAGLRALVRQRLAAFALILVIGLLLLASMAVTAALAGLRELLTEHFPALGRVLPHLNFVLSFAMASALFALVYKVLPDAPLPWRDVWLGGVATALLFTVGKTLIGLYLGRTGTASIYGAAGSLVVLLLWVYYSAQIVLIGAELTAVWARRFGSQRPRTNDAA